MNHSRTSLQMIHQEEPACQGNYWPEGDRPGRIQVTGNGCFTSLKPGESYSVTYSDLLYPWGEFAEEFKVGEKYSYRYNGGVVKWWDWGSLGVWRSHCCTSDLAYESCCRIIKTLPWHWMRRAMIRDSRLLFLGQTLSISW